MNTHEFNHICIRIAETMGANHVTIEHDDNFIGGFCTPHFCASVDEPFLWEVAPKKAQFPNQILHKSANGQWTLYEMRYVGDRQGYKTAHVYQD